MLSVLPAVDQGVISVLVVLQPSIQSREQLPASQFAQTMLPITISMALSVGSVIHSVRPVLEETILSVPPVLPMCTQFRELQPPALLLALIMPLTSISMGLCAEPAIHFVRAVLVQATLSA